MAMLVNTIPLLLLKGFGMTVHAFDPFIDRAKKLKMMALFMKPTWKICTATVKYISLNVPATPQTKGSINYDLFKLMPEKCNPSLIQLAKKLLTKPVCLRLLPNAKIFVIFSDVAPDCAAETLARNIQNALISHLKKNWCAN